MTTSEVPDVDFFFEDRLDGFGAGDFTQNEFDMFVGNLQALIQIQRALVPSCKKRKLHTDGFDDEMIWTQVERMNESTFELARTTLPTLENVRRILKEDVSQKSVSFADTAQVIDDLKKKPGRSKQKKDTEGARVKTRNVDSKTGKGRDSPSAVDDEFFSLSAMNEFLKEEEEREMQDGPQEREPEEEEDIDVFDSLSDGDDEDGMETYADMYDPPPKAMAADIKTHTQDQSVDSRSSSSSEEAQSDISDDERGTLKVKSLALLENAREYEQKNMQQRHWSLMGEVSSRERPENSLLDLDVDFDGGVKLPPIPTEERTTDIAKEIKARIISERFDDVEPPAEGDDVVEEKERVKLDDRKSKTSLAEIYEKEYLNQMDIISNKGEKINEQHEEIKKLVSKLSYNLEALSNYAFAPKRHKEIKIKSTVPSIKLEEAVPYVGSHTVSAAPEEVAAPTLDLKGEKELTRTQKRRINKKKRKGNVVEKPVTKKHSRTEKQPKFGSSKYMKELKNIVKADIEKKKPKK